MNVRCPECGYDNPEGTVICMNCHHLLIQLSTDPDGATLRQNDLPGGEPEKKLILQPRYARHTGTLGLERVAIYVGDLDEPLIVEVKHQAILGRQSEKSKEQPGIDLSSYNAFGKGVSRLHAAIHHKDGAWFIEDLASSNGTWLNNTRLQPYVLTALKSGDQVRLSQLRIEVYFGSAAIAKAQADSAELKNQTPKPDETVR